MDGDWTHNIFVRRKNVSVTEFHHFTNTEKKYFSYNYLFKMPICCVFGCSNRTKRRKKEVELEQNTEGIKITLFLLYVDLSC